MAPVLSEEDAEEADAEDDEEEESRAAPGRGVEGGREGRLRFIGDAATEEEVDGDDAEEEEAFLFFRRCLGVM